MTWTSAQHHYLLDSLLKATRAGKAVENGWKLEAWEEVKRELNVEFETNYTIKQLKSAMKGLKAKYLVVKRLKRSKWFWMGSNSTNSYS